jgi:hypothetical protein
MAVASKPAAGMSSVQTSAKDSTNAIAAVATDLATALLLVNDLRTIMINAGLA